MTTQEQVAQCLLEAKAVKLRPETPFTWASGWKSPIYCDNRKMNSHVRARRYFVNMFVELIQQKYPNAKCIVGVATGAISWGALVADRLNLPYLYVRSAAKDHGLENLVEGDLEQCKDAVVIEDLISTGGSSIKAVQALRHEGVNVLGMLAIFTYGFEKAQKAFDAEKCELETLSSYEELLPQAIAMGLVNEDQLETLKEWRQSPSTWGV